MQFLHQLRFLKLFSPFIIIQFLSGCTTVTYPDGTRVSTPYVSPCYGYAYGYGGGYSAYSPCGVGVYTGGYYPVYGNCFGSGWGSWGGWGWYRSGGCGYANNSGNTTINVNRTTTVTGTCGIPYSRSLSGTFGSGSYSRTRPYTGTQGNTSMQLAHGTYGNRGRSYYGGGMRGMH